MSVMKVSKPIDMIAFAPIALGFHPAESVVMLTFGGTTFHARLDMPRTEGTDALQAATDALLNPAKRHEVERVVFLFYTDTSDAVSLWTFLRLSFLDAGIEIVDALRIHEGQFTSMTHANVTGSADISTHPITVQAAVEGGVSALGNREEMRTQLAVRDTLDTDWLPQPIPATSDYFEPEREMVREILRECIDERRIFTSAELGTMLVDLAVGELRDTVLRSMALAPRENRRRHVDLWADATARAPQGYRAFPAAMFGMAAYLAGNGAAAWIGVDVAREEDPDTALANLLADVLERALPPEVVASLFKED